MKRTLWIPLLLASGASLLAACDDDADKTPEADMAIDMAITPDAAPMIDMEIAPDPDMNVVDMQVVDMQVVDMEVDMAIDASTLIERGPECVDDGDCAGDFQRCADDLCSYDLWPEVFVVNEITVVEPAASAELIQVFIRDAVADNLLNLLIEPDSYQDTGEYLWYIGNGGFRDGEYEYLGNYPIQNFYGFWRNEPLPVLLQEEGNEGPTVQWHPDEEVIFLLNVPTGTVQDPDQPNNPNARVTCSARIPVTVRLVLTPSLDAQGDPIIRAMVAGYLTADDAEQVNFRVGGSSVGLTELLSDDDLEDTDGDGLNDAYPFAFVASAVPITFIGDPPDGMNRDPNPDFELPAACNE